MKLRGLTQDEVAEAAGVTQPTVQRWLKGSIPGSEELFKLCASLGERMEDFFGERPRSSAVERLRTKPEPPPWRMIEKALNEIADAKDRLGEAESTLKKISSPKTVASGAARILDAAKQAIDAKSEQPSPASQPSADAHQSSDEPPPPGRPAKKQSH